MLHNLGGKSQPGVQVQLWDDAYNCATYLFEERDIWDIRGRELCVDLDPYGFCWLRLRLH